MFDIDYFKNVNDSYGHDVGDKVLQSLTAVVKALMKSDDLLGRYGGEEFLICMPNTTLEEAYERTNLIRQAIENIRFLEKNQEFIVTSSFGIFSHQFTINVESAFFQRMIQHADQALYLAKGKGRNRIEVYDNKKVPYP